MGKNLAKLLSYIFHPLLMPTYGIAIVFYYLPLLSALITPHGQNIVYGIVFITTFIFPGATAFTLLQRGLISSLEMETITERRLPFLSTAVYYLIGYYVLKKIHIPPVFNVIVLGAAVSVLASVLINLRWKISIHMIGIGGVAGLMAGLAVRFGLDLHMPFIAILLLAGLLGTARLKLYSHSPAQVYAGFLTGFASEFFMLVPVKWAAFLS